MGARARGVEEIEIPVVVEDAEQEAATGEATTEDGDAGTAETEAPTNPRSRHKR